MTSQDSHPTYPGYWVERYLQVAEENTKLRAENNALVGTVNGHVVRDPGVYVVEADPERGPGVNLRVTKHLHRDAVVLTARPDEEPAEWWQTYRDGITGNLVAWKPPKYLHDLIAHTAKHAHDPSAKSYGGTAYWMGMDPGKHGDDMTAATYYGTETMTSKDNPRQPDPDPGYWAERYLQMVEENTKHLARIRELDAENTKLHIENTKLHSQLNALAQRRDPPGGWVSLRLHAERLARLEEQAEMANRNQQLMAPRLAQLEAQMVTKLTEVSYPTQQMAERVDQLEAWARQFDNRRFELGGGRAGVFAVQPLDRMEPKG